MATPLFIIKIVFDYFGIPYETRDKKCRQRELVSARQISMFYLKQNTKLSLAQIGSMFRKDHATVVYAIKTVNNLAQVDRDYRQDLKAIGKSIELRIFEEAPTNEWICKYYQTENV